MRKTRSYLAGLCVGASALVLTACGGGGSGSSSPATTVTTTPPAPSTTPPPASTPTPTPTGFTVTALVSNTAAGTVDTLAAANVATGDSATFTLPKTQNPNADPNLSGAWGLAFGPGSSAWVNDEASNMSSLYDGTGTPIASLPSVAVAGGPTGIVANVNTTSCPTLVAASCTGFNTSGFAAGGGSAQFLFASLNGNLYAWATGTSAQQVASGAAGSKYTGLTNFTQSSGSTFLLAANFALGTVDVFDANYQANTTAFPGGFKDPNLPKGYAPFGIQQIGGLIYVTYAEQPTSPGPEVDGAGLGQIDVFDATGTLVKTLAGVGGALNAPWGMVLAPQGFGSFGGDLLVGNFGDGRINVFDPNSGQMIGTLTDAATSAPVRIPGLWGLAFGNNAFSQAPTTLYYAAQPDHKTQGLYGAIAVPTASSTAGASPAASNPFGY